MLEEAKKKSPAEVQKSRQLGATTLDAIRSMRAMKGEIKAKSPEEQKSKMPLDKLARRMKGEEEATKNAVVQAEVSAREIKRQMGAAAKKTKKVQDAPPQAGPAGIHSEIESRIDKHANQEFLHNTSISNLLADLNNIQHQVDIAHAQKKISDADRENFSGMINGIKNVHIARANFDTLRNAINWGLPVTRELLNHMHKRSQFEFNPKEKGAKNKRDERISYLNRLAASIGHPPTTTAPPRWLGIPLGFKKTKNIYESKKHKKHPHVKVSGQSEEKYTERGGIEGKKSNPPSGSSSGEEWLEQTIHTIKDVILERTAGRPAPIKHSRVGTTYGRRRANVYVIGSSLRHRLDRYRKNALRDRLGLLQRRSRRLTNG